MGHREKFTLILFLLCYLCLFFCMPQCLSYNKRYALDKLKTNVMKSTQLAELQNPKKYKYVKAHKIDKKRLKLNKAVENKRLQKDYNFPEIEYPLVSTPRTPYYLLESNFENDISLNKFPIDKLTKLSNDLKKAAKFKRKFENLSGYSNNCHLVKNITKPIDTTLLGTAADSFLEIDYPLGISEIRTPIYWRTHFSDTNENQQNGLLSLLSNTTSTNERFIPENRKEQIRKRKKSNKLNLNKVQIKSKNINAFTPYIVNNTDNVKSKTDNLKTMTTLLPPTYTKKDFEKTIKPYTLDDNLIRSEIKYTTVIPSTASYVRITTEKVKEDNVCNPVIFKSYNQSSTAIKQDSTTKNIYIQSSFDSNGNTTTQYDKLQFDEVMRNEVENSVQTTTVYIMPVNDKVNITYLHSDILSTIKPEEPSLFLTTETPLYSDIKQAKLITNSSVNQNNILLDYFIDETSSTISDYYTSSFDLTISPLTTNDFHFQQLSEDQSTISINEVAEFPLATSTEMITTCQSSSNESNYILNSSKLKITEAYKPSTENLQYIQNNNDLTNTILDLSDELNNGNSEFIYYSSSTLSPLSDFEDFGAVTAPEF